MQELIPGFVPEDDTERELAGDPTLREGWAWGKPRKGHPEGAVGAHVGKGFTTGPILSVGAADERRSDSSGIHWAFSNEL